MLAVWQRLADAQTFIEVATSVCVEAAPLYGRFCISLHDPHGTPLIAVDSAPGLACAGGADDRRRAWFTAAREHREDDDGAMIAPLVEPHGVFGVMCCARAEVYSALERAALSVLGAQVSVRLAQLGITTLPHDIDLTPRQHVVADLASRGFSNDEVARALAISANTVKKQLKDVYRRLDVANRTELARVLPRLAATDVDAPLGVTQVGGVTITRRAG